MRWEIATAVAGAMLGINPFDEPNVQQAKDATQQLLGKYKTTKRLPMPAPDATTPDEHRVDADHDRAERAARRPPTRS